MDSSSAGSRVVIIAVVGALLIAGGAAMSVIGTPLIFPTQASSEAGQVDNLFRVLLAIGGAIFLLVQGALLWSVIKFRADPGDMSDGPHIHGNTTLEIVWTAIPAVIVFVLAVLSFQVWMDIRAVKENEQVVQVLGQRFNWTFSYEAPVAEGVLSSPQLHTYVGRPVKLEMNTPDVIHSFWVPAMRVKQDLLPGRTTEVRFTPVEAGVFPVVCAELCGSGHGDMRAQIVVHEDEAAFNAWFEERVAAIISPPEDPAMRGEQILSSGALPCNSCHTLDALDWTGQVGPNLNGIGDRAARRVPGLTAEEYLQQSIRSPAGFLVSGFGGVMPAFGPDEISDEDLQAIVAYLLAQTG